jgi:hypothetical protein
MQIDRPQGVLFLCFFFQQAMANLSESFWFVANAPIFFCAMALATFTLARSLLDARFRRFFGSPSAVASSARAAAPRGISAR